jgi:hypothetical protein
MSPEPNPYAPPRDFGMLPGAAQSPGAPPQGFRTREVLEEAWPAFKKHWPVLLASLMVASIPSSVLSFIPAFALLARLVEPNSVEYFTVYGISTLLSMIVSYFFLVGYIRIILDAARGKAPDFMTIFSGFDRYFSFLGTNLVLGLAVFIGTLLLIVPGVILLLGFGLANFYCVDARLGPIAALGASWRAMRGYKLEMFLFLLAGILIYCLGMLACCVGSLPAAVFVYVGWGIVYVRLSGHVQAPFSSRGA